MSLETVNGTVSSPNTATRSREAAATISNHQGNMSTKSQKNLSNATSPVLNCKATGQQPNGVLENSFLPKSNHLNQKSRINDLENPGRVSRKSVSLEEQFKAACDAIQNLPKNGKPQNRASVFDSSPN